MTWLSRPLNMDHGDDDCVMCRFVRETDACQWDELMEVIIRLDACLNASETRLETMQKTLNVLIQKMADSQS